MRAIGDLGNPSCYFLAGPTATVVGWLCYYLLELAELRRIQ